MRTIYIAGKFEAQDRLRHERNRIHWLGLGVVIGTWLDEASASSYDVTPEQMYEFATRDRKEILAANLLILDTVDENRRGGREVEFGIALGSGIEAWVIGPKRNVFHTLAPSFLSWDDVLDALTKEVA